MTCTIRDRPGFVAGVVPVGHGVYFLAAYVAGGQPGTSTWAAARSGSLPRGEPQVILERVPSDEPLIATSAFKHGVGEEDILQAYRNPLRVWDLGEGFTMMIGANHAAIVYEIGYVQGVETVVIVHAMRAREKFLR